MINIIVVADDIANDFGSYFKLSHEFLIKELSMTTIKLHSIIGNSCLPNVVTEAIVSLENQPFVFVGYSHGKPDALVSTAAESGYVNVDNAYCFGTSLFYTTSCLSAKGLKQLLIDSNCYAYVGYDDKVVVPTSEHDQEIFASCENRALVHFLTTDDSLIESIEVMKRQVWTQWDEYLKSDMYVTASLLMQNMSCLVVHDDRQLKKAHLIPSDPR